MSDRRIRLKLIPACICWTISRCFEDRYSPIFAQEKFTDESESVLEVLESKKNQRGTGFAF